MSVSCIWFLICEHSTIDRDREIISLLECFDTIKATSFPAVYRPLELNLYLRREIEESASDLPVCLQFVVEPPGRDEVRVAEYNGQFPMGTWKMRLRAPLNGGFGFKSPGIYWFRVDILEGNGWKSLARYSMEVLEVSEQEFMAASIPLDTST